MWEAILGCGCLSAVYVGSLYVWKCPHGRDHPQTIKRRFLSAFAMSLVSPLYTWSAMPSEALEKASLAELMGLRLQGLFAATALPLLLTAVLFAGPMAMYALSGLLKMCLEPTYWLNSLEDLVWIRNFIVAPISEEFSYRSCMMPVLLHTMSPTAAVVVCPLFFGIAHFHHAVENLRSGQSVSTTIKISCFQFAYTTLFGAYSAYLFYRTGHFAAPLVAHTFCNHMGFPNFAAIPLYPKNQKYFILVLFLLGFIAWCFLLVPLTNPVYYHNNIYWDIK